MAKKRRKKAKKSRGIFDLNEHDEHKVLLLTIGLVFGMALACLIFRVYTYVALAFVAIGLVLAMIEKREQKLQ